MEKAELIDWLRAKAEKLRKQNKSCERIVALLEPEMVKFDARTAYDVYTVRMSVDHTSSLRAQVKEVEMLEAAAKMLEGSCGQENADV